MKVSTLRIRGGRRTSIIFMAAVCLFVFNISPPITKGQSTETYNWSNVAMGGGGFVSGIITSKTQQNLIYARTDVGGAYRWDATNGTWIPLLDWVSENETGFLGVESLAIDQRTPSNVYILAGISYFNGGKTAILRSSDNGNTFSVTDVSAQFKAHGNGMGRQSGEKLVVDPNSGSILFCGTRSNGLFKSTNSGAAWSAVTSLGVTTTPNGNGISFVVFDPSTGTNGSATQTLIAGVSRMGSTNLYRSNDGGNTFTGISGAPTTLIPQRAVMASDRTLYITYANGAGPYGTTAEPMDVGQIWKYNLQSGVWTNITPSSFTWAFSGISVDPNNTNRLVASSVNTYNAQGGAWGDWFFLSTDGGTTWTNVVTRGYSIDNQGIPWMTSSQSIHWAGCIEFDPFNTGIVWVTSGNGVFRNDNINATAGVWKFMVKGLEETVPLGLESIPNGGPLISVIGDYDGFKQTDPAQYGSQNAPTMGSTSGLAYGAQNTTKVVRVGSSMYYSTNTGQTWTQCSINGSQGQVAVSADGNTFLHCPGTWSTTYRSTNNGSSWTTVTGLNVADAKPVADPMNTNKFYAYNPSNGAMMVSTDAGVSFSASGSTASGGSKNIRTAPSKEGHLWVALYGGGLSRSINSGQTFTTISGVTYCGSVGLGKEAPGSNYPTLYIWGTVNNVLGVYRSTNEGSSWVRINDDAHEYGGPANGQFVAGDMNVYGRVYMSTAGRGVAYGTASTTTTNSLTVSPTSLSFTAVAGNQTINVTSNVSWTVTDNQSWITLSSASGSNNGTLTVSATANTATTSRTGAVTISGGNVTQTVSITQSGSSSCTPTAIVPYLQVNAGAWQQVSTASLAAGGAVKFGPQPISGGSWNWTGPNSFTATTREVTISNIQAIQGGSYMASFTNASGCLSTQTFNVTVTGTTSNSIVVRARGTQGGETIDVRVNNTTLNTFTLTTSYQDFTTSGSGTVAIFFTNDNGARDVQIDYAVIGGTTYQAENQSGNTGVWFNNACGGSNSEWLQCNGSITFTGAVASASIATSSTKLTASTESQVGLELIAYPNPTTDNITIRFSKEVKSGKATLITATGDILLTNRVMGYEHQVDMSQLPAGLYLLHVADKTSRAITKVIKK